MNPLLNSSAASLRRTRGLLLAVLAASLLGGCGAFVAQNPAGNLRPVNAIADGNDQRVLLNGADVALPTSSTASTGRGNRSSAAATRM